MPRVPAAPTITGGNTVKSRPLRIPLAPVSTVDTSGLARGLAVAGVAIERGNLQLSQIRLSEAETETMKRWNQRLYEDDDAYYKLNGKESVEALNPRMEELEAIRDEVANNTLQGGREQRLFANAMASRNQQNRTKMAMRSFDERQNWDKATALANIETQFESAAADPSAENLLVTKVRVQEEAASIARIEGMPPEQQQVAVDKAISGMYRSAIESVMPGDFRRSQEMLDQYGKELLTGDRQILQEKLKEFSLAQRTLEKTSDLRQFVTLDRQLQEADKIKDLELRKSVRRELTIQDNQDTTGKAQVNRENYGELAQLVMDGTRVAAIRDADQDRYLSLTPAQKLHLDAIEAQKATGEPIVTKPERWSELVLMSPQELAKLDPVDDYLNLHKTEWLKLVGMVKDARAGEMSTKSRSIMTPYQRLSIAIGGPKKLKKPEGQLLTTELTERLQEFNQNEGRNPNDVELDQMIGKLVVDARLPGIGIAGLFGPAPVFGRDTPVFKLDVSDVPTQTSIKIVDYYNRRFQRNPTDNEIIDAYALILNDERDK